MHTLGDRNRRALQTLSSSFRFRSGLHPLDSLSKQKADCTLISAVHSLGSRALCGGTGIRTPDPLHAIGSRPVHERSIWSKRASFVELSIHLRSSKFTSIQCNC